jgi:hypothetical protein
MKSIYLLFRELKQEAPSLLLRDRVLRAVAQAKERQTILYRRWSSLGIALSLLTLVWGGVEYETALLQSDFWTLITLLFSDIDVVMRSLGDFGYSLLETLPIMPLLILFTPLTLFFWSMSFLLSLPSHDTKVSRSLFAH